MNTDLQDKTAESDEIEINLVDILDFFKEHYGKIVLSGILAAIVGALYSLTLPNEYQSKAQLLPEIQGNSSSNMGGLSALAGLAGINMPTGGAGTEAIRPDLYPNILQSVEFALYLLKQPVYVHEFKKTTPLEQYFDKKNETWWSSFFTSKPKKEERLDPKNESNALELTKKQQAMISNLSNRVSAVIDRKSGIITVNAEMPDPVVAASVANISIKYLKDYVTVYRTGKTKQQFGFLGDRVAEAKGRLNAAEMALAGFKDRNRFLEMRTAIVSEQRLTANFMLAQKVYDGLVQQYEQSKVKIQEDTPILKILEPAQIPLQRSSPKRTMITLFGGIMGIMLCLGYLLAMKFLQP